MRAAILVGGHGKGGVVNVSTTSNSFGTTLLIIRKLGFSSVGLCCLAITTTEKVLSSNLLVPLTLTLLLNQILPISTNYRCYVYFKLP